MGDSPPFSGHTQVKESLLAILLDDTDINYAKIVILNAQPHTDAEYLQ